MKAKKSKSKKQKPCSICDKTRRALRRVFRIPERTKK